MLVMPKCIHFSLWKITVYIDYELTCLWICYAIRRISCLYYYILDVSSRNTLDVDVSSRMHVLYNQEINIELSYIIVSMQTYSTILHQLIYVNWLAGEKVLLIRCWEPIITNLLCHQYVKIVQTLFLSVHSFMPLHANETHWVNVFERQILINPGRVLKQCYLHNNMDDILLLFRL